MKAVIQRCLSASVAVEGKTISSIGKGLLVLVGIDRHDEPPDSTTIIKKILSAKLFSDDDGKLWQKSVVDVGGEVLCVSQFTLLAVFKGSKPDFHESMSTLPGKAMYTAFLGELRAAYVPEKIKDGQFGAMMQVSLVNDGPTTILLSSRDTRSSKPGSGSSTPLPLTAGTPIMDGGPASAAAAADKDMQAAQAHDRARKAEIAAAKARRRAEFEGNAEKKAEIARLAEVRRKEKAERNEEKSREMKADGQKGQTAQTGD